MRILITGANGQLGMCLRRSFAHAAQDVIYTDVVEGPDTQYLDITDLQAVRAMVQAEKTDVVINCAAYTNVDAAEDHPEQAELLNAKAVENLALSMKEVDGLLVHISTDYVFGKEPYNRPCREDQKGTPTGVYGLTKLHGEQAVLQSGVRHVIIRTGWLYSEFGRNFVRTMLRLTAEKPSLKVVFDQVGTPTYAGDLAEAIVCILKKVEASPEGASALFLAPAWALPSADDSHVYHYSNEGVCSWYDFAKAVAAYAGHTDCDIQPCHSDEFPSKVARPAFSVLDKTKIKSSFGLRIPYWTDSLKTCIRRLTDR